MAQGKNAAQAAEAAGVNRSSVFRWQKEDAEFAKLIEEERVKLDAVEDPKTLESLVSLAHAQLKLALSGGSITASQAKIALDVLKAARTVSDAGPGASGTLAARLAELDDQKVSD